MVHYRHLCVCGCVGTGRNNIRMQVALVLCLIALSLCGCGGAILRDDQIEWQVSESQIGFWSKQSARGTPILITLRPDITASDALIELAKHLPVPKPEVAAGVVPRCRFVDTTSNEILADDMSAVDPIPLALLLKKRAADMSIHCAAGSIAGAELKLQLTVFVPPEVPSADRKWVGSKEYPNNAVDLIADTLSGVLHWATEFLAVHWGPVHPFNDWTSSGTSGRFNLNTGAPISVDTPGRTAFDMMKKTSAGTSDSEVRLALTADWGSGTMESAYVSDLLVAGYEPHWTVHIGDVYYLGASEDFASNVFGLPPAGVAHGITWPHGSIGSFGLMGNHEMYSRGMAYFDEFLPTLGVRNSSGVLGGQSASYFSLENEYWRVIALDTGYHTYSEIFESNNNYQPQAVIDWLINDVVIGDPNDKRGIIIFSHHQTFSAFGGDDKYLATPKQIVDLLPANRTVLWLWGHEHRVAFYDYNSGLDGVTGLSLYGRCIGNGGYPTSVAEIPKRAAETNLAVYDDRVYTVVDGFSERQLGFQGWNWLNFTGPVLSIDYKSLKFGPDGQLSSTESDLLVTEQWTTDEFGSVSRQSFTVVNSNMTIVT